MQLGTALAKIGMNISDEFILKDLKKDNDMLVLPAEGKYLQ
jgi:hypothetical protein